MKKIATWAGFVLTALGLIGWAGKTAVRINEVEKKAERVDELSKDVHTIKVYIKLKDPALYLKAEELSN